MIEPYAPKGLERVEPMLRDSANPPAWVGIDAWETAIVYNTAEAKAKGLPPIKSYQDLLRPEFKGQIVMSNPNSSGTGFLAVTGLIHLMGEEKAFEYMDKLHENIAMYTHSGSAPAKKAAAGRVRRRNFLRLRGHEPEEEGRAHRSNLPRKRAAAGTLRPTL